MYWYAYLKIISVNRISAFSARRSVISAVSYNFPAKYFISISTFHSVSSGRSYNPDNPDPAVFCGSHQESQNGSFSRRRSSPHRFLRSHRAWPVYRKIPLQLPLPAKTEIGGHDRLFLLFPILLSSLQNSSLPCLLSLPRQYTGGCPRSVFEKISNNFSARYFYR